MYPPSIQKLIYIFSKFPAIGRRTAARFVFYLIKMPQNEYNDLITAMNGLRANIKTCAFCFDHFDNGGGESLCPICKNNSRDKTILCIIEKESDLITIENTKKYNGLYFILGGTVSALKKDDIAKLKITELEERIKNPASVLPNNPNFKEIIIATNPTVEGEATSLLIQKKIKTLALPEGKKIPKITRLGRGLPIGGELEYADDETLENALSGRK